MRLPACWNCHYSFRWRELLWKSQPLCPQCREKQFITKKSRNKSFLLSMLLTVSIILFPNFNSSIFVLLSLVLLLLLSSLMVLPFIYEYTDKEQPYI